MQVRPADPEDVSQLVLIDKLAFGSMALEKEDWERHVEAGYCLVVAGKPAQGFLLLTYEDNQVLNISRLGVNPKQQSKGVGTLLLTTVLEGAPRARLLVETSNLQAIKLYRKMGFDIIGEFQSDGHEGHYVMWRGAA